MVRPVSNPPNPWLSEHVELLGEPPPAELVVYEEDAVDIVSTNDSPDVDFRYSLNPYRGCFHACAYCYARPTHQYLGWGAGTDFDRRIVVKRNAPQRLRERFAKPSWKGEMLAFSGVTDAYQPLEASYELTRRCLEVCVEHRNPVRIVTKGALVRRDVELLAELARTTSVSVDVSLPVADEQVSRGIEPSASPPSLRLEALAALADAGIPTGVFVAPVIPGLTDEHIPDVLQRAQAAGAQWARLIMLRLPAEVADVFTERITEEFPLRAKRILDAVAELRGGRMNETAFGRRLAGLGPRWAAIEALFDTHRRRLGLANSPPPPREDTFRRPDGQGRLFEGS